MTDGVVSHPLADITSPLSEVSASASYPQAQGLDNNPTPNTVAVGIASEYRVLGLYSISL